ncbi:MAG: hypothetical protein N3H31_01440 [Candidatus Nezhaarchaeota archaeon]|nr:hypothetical protein [Candidatus Nezhaarchaeota archaeon]
MTSIPRQLRNRISEALALIEKWPRVSGKVTILAKRSVDGACSAGIMAKLLTYYNCPFEARALGLEELAGTLQRSSTVILDLPLPLSTRAEGGWLQVGHLPPFRGEDEVLSIHSELSGLNGFTEACTSSLIYLLAHEAGVVEDEGSIMLLCAGIQGEEQVGSLSSPLQGLNRELVMPLVEKGLVRVGRSLSLFSSEVPLSLGLTVTLDPPLKRILGSEDDAKRLLEKAGLINLSDKPLSTLSEEIRSKLIQCLLTEALASGLEILEAEKLLRISLRVRAEERVEDMAEASRTIDACAKLGRLALSIQSFLKRRPSALDKERLEASFTYIAHLARKTRDLVMHLDTQPTTCLFELSPELRGFTLDVARCLATLYPLMMLGIYTRANNLLKVSIAWGRKATEGKEITSRLMSLAEAHQGLLEVGHRWLEIVVSAEVMDQVKALLKC